MTPHRCPKCDGKAWLQYDPAAPFAAAGVGPWRCPACRDGIIWAADPLPYFQPPVVVPLQPWPNGVPAQPSFPQNPCDPPYVVTCQNLDGGVAVGSQPLASCAVSH